MSSQAPPEDDLDELDYSLLDELDELDEDTRARYLEALEEADEMVEFPAPYSQEGLLELLTEIAYQDLFALTFDGEYWVVTPAVLIDAATPRLLNERERCRRRAPYPFDELVDVLAGKEDKVDFALLERAEVVPYRIGPNSTIRGIPLNTQAGPSPINVIRPDLVRLESLDAAVRSRLAKLAKAEDSALVDHRGEPPASWKYETQRLNESVMAHFRSFFAAPPEVGVRVRPPEQWFMGEPTEWYADDGFCEVGLQDLSQAHRRWALLSTTLALAAGAPADPDRSPLVQRDFFAADELPIAPRITVIGLDEPDGALHATAQRHAVDGLAGG